MIQISNLALNFHEEVLFSEVTLNLNPAHNYGLVGANGSGKSSLLKLISGQLSPSKGNINFPGGARIGYLKQFTAEYDDCTIIDLVMMGNINLWQAMYEKKQLLAKSKLNNEQGIKLAKLEQIIADYDGYQAEVRATEILTNLGVSPEKHEQELKSLSGGFKIRVMLAQLLFGKFDVLVLDEPTNHLDLPASVWLEGFLKETKIMVIFASHDRYFLNRLSDYILDIDYQTIKSYAGNYDDYLKTKTSIDEQQKKDIANQIQKRDLLEKYIQRFSAKATKARQANSKKKLVKKMVLPTIKTSSRIAYQYNFSGEAKSARRVLVADDIAKSYAAQKIFENINFECLLGEKIVLIGSNGLGKSTMLKVLAGIITPDKGEVKLGSNVKVGYFAQEIKELLGESGSTNVYDWIYAKTSGLSSHEVHSILAKVKLKKGDNKKLIKVLSGGELSRLYFAYLMAIKPNLLLLDEPTNHLDLESIEALTGALQRFAGTLFFISHDRFIIDQVATRIMLFTPKGVFFYQGTYQEYLYYQQKNEHDAGNNCGEVTNVNANTNEGGEVGKVFLAGSDSRLSIKATPKEIDESKSKLNWLASREKAKQLRKKEKTEQKITTLEAKLATIRAKLADLTLYEAKNKQKLHDLQLTEKDLSSEVECLWSEFYELEGQNES
ncbi:MAG: ABC-F family ATP-binding cassette domain-containing protein [SAR324 cluster bacterium]|nr:ABC-F family ATP-binding cassette domain-containing protein [SAR324 cluster bacterium]